MDGGEAVQKKRKEADLDSEVENEMKKLLAIFIAYILIILFALLLKISSIVYKEGCSMSASNKRHFDFLNFPTVSSLLHIRMILVHWPLLEISGPQKWVVGTTQAEISGWNTENGGHFTHFKSKNYSWN